MQTLSPRSRLSHPIARVPSLGCYSRINKFLQFSLLDPIKFRNVIQKCIQLGPNFLILVVCAFEERITRPAPPSNFAFEISKKLHSIWKGTDDTRKRDQKLLDRQCLPSFSGCDSPRALSPLGSINAPGKLSEIEFSFSRLAAARFLRETLSPLALIY